MTKAKNVEVAKPTKEEVEHHIHHAYHFLHDWSHSPDADDWLREYLKKAVDLLYPETVLGTENTVEVSHETLTNRVVEVSQYLLEAGMERRDDMLFRYNVLIAVGLLIGKPYDGPIYYRENK